MARSEQTNELAVSLAKVQGSITHAVKDSENPFHKNKYADLASVWEACRKQLAENGLSIVQLPDGLEDGCLILDTTMLHTSGQWISSRIKMPLQKQDPQGYGSTLTYARRYALAAMVGVYQDDDDANEGTIPKSQSKQQNKPTNTNIPTAPQKPSTTQATKPQSEPTKATDGQVKSLYIKCTKEGMSQDDVHQLIEWKYGIKSAKDLLIPDFAYLMNNITKAWSDYVEYQSKKDGN
ncbi:MAG: superfamily protein [Firmicutes bacterium]|nr:superfamily protein [Bacillota bacterium]